MIYGKFGSQSKLSESGGYGDIYFEETWEDQDGGLVKTQRRSSIMVKGSSIQALIFFYVTRENA